MIIHFSLHKGFKRKKMQNSKNIRQFFFSFSIVPQILFRRKLQFRFLETASNVIAF